MFAAALLLVAGCSPAGDVPDYPDLNSSADPVITTITEASGIVTVKRNEEGLVYLQFGHLRLLPDALEFSRQERAMAQMVIYPEKVGPGNGYYKTQLDWLEAIDEGVFGPMATGGAPFDILLTSPYTCVEDGYLNIHYKTWWGETPQHHDFYLSSDPAEPYALTLVQHTHGDAKDNCTDGLIYFDINDLPRTEGKTLTISVNWTKLDGNTGTAYFGFKTRE